VHSADVPDPPTGHVLRVDAVGLTVVAGRGPDSTLLTLTGELDYATRPTFELAVSQALRTGPPNLVVDLAGLTFVAVAGAHAFEETNLLCSGDGGRLVLLNPCRQARRLLDLFGISAMVGCPRVP
jgi:anti-anti-sigma factor